MKRMFKNSDGQQVHQYKKNRLSPQIIEHKKDQDSWR